MQPRDWLKNPDVFGLDRDTVWRPVPVGIAADDLAERSAAFLQHKFACQIEEQFRKSGQKAKDLAAELGMEAGHLSHILRGRQTVSVQTIVMFVQVLGSVALFPVVDELDDLTPPE